MEVMQGHSDDSTIHCIYMPSSANGMLNSTGSHHHHYYFSYLVMSLPGLPQTITVKSFMVRDPRTRKQIQTWLLLEVMRPDWISAFFWWCGRYQATPTHLPRRCWGAPCAGGSERHCHRDTHGNPSCRRKAGQREAGSKSPITSFSTEPNTPTPTHPKGKALVLLKSSSHFPNYSSVTWCSVQRRISLLRLERWSCPLPAPYVPVHQALGC